MVIRVDKKKAAWRMVRVDDVWEERVLSWAGRTNFPRGYTEDETLACAGASCGKPGKPATGGPNPWETVDGGQDVVDPRPAHRVACTIHGLNSKM